MDAGSLTEALNSIDIEDLHYVEKDLCFYELVSLAFLLYGEDRTTAEFALQKLLVISNISASATAPLSPAAASTTGFLHTYATTINKIRWRAYIVEALAIINARRVLRKLGFKWLTVSQHYLPHVSELSLHIHPLLKALYKICESMTSGQAGRLISYMYEHHRRPENHLRFYDNMCLEVFLLDWITRRIISVGNREANDAELRVLFEYFKLNDQDDFKILLIQAVRHGIDDQNIITTDSNSDAPEIEYEKEDENANGKAGTKTSFPSTPSLNNQAKSTAAEFCNGTNSVDLNHSYKVQHENAGIVLIINQRQFTEETSPEWKDLLPEHKLADRNGTDFDRDIIGKAFSAHGYKAIVRENLSHIELLHTIRENAKRSICFDSFVVCILSHGFDGLVCGSNSIPVEIAEIEDIFTTESLRHKPKLLIVQACQTKPAKPAKFYKHEKKKTDPEDFADVLKVMSSVPGFPSLRHTRQGSWFIQTLGNAIIQYGNSKHLMDIMTIVTSNVSKKRGEERDEVMLPICTTTLRRNFFLPPRKGNI